MTSITVTLPVFNGMPYVVEAVESVLGQTCTDFEFLIIDDGSTDGSTEYLRSLRDPRVTLICRENRGLGATLNELFSKSRTEYVARMDADDVCEPTRIAEQVSFLSDRRDIVMLGTGINFLVEGRLLDGFRPLTDHSQIRNRLMQKRPGVNHPTIVVKRTAWEAVGGYRFSGAGEDLDFCLRLCDFGAVTNIPDPLYRYRLGSQSLTFRKAAETNRGYAFAIVCAKAREQSAGEPAIDDFRRQWEQRSALSRASELLYTVGENLYRSSIIRRAQGRYLSSRACLLGAAVCMPHVALFRIVQRNRRRSAGRASIDAPATQKSSIAAAESK